MDLIRRNIIEIVTEEELISLLKEKKHPLVYCGYETSGPVHIGTMVTVMKLADLQKAGFDVKVLLADVHTHLNKKGEADWVEQMVEYWRECFIGLGLNAKFIRGSEFEFERGYIHDVLELGLKTTLNRAMRSMQEIARDLENASVSQMIYPLMQIADIKALSVDIALGGMEQRKIHMLAREALPLIGYKKPVCIHTPLLCSLQGPDSKMSSSKPETMIAVDEQPEEIKKRINYAFCPPETEGNPILQVCRYLIFPTLGRLDIKRLERFGGDLAFDSYDAVEKNYADKKLHPMDLKNAVADSLVKILAPVREHLERKGIDYKKIIS